MTEQRRPVNKGQPGPVAIGDVRRFLSTLQGADGAGILVRRYTDQFVTILDSQGHSEGGDEEEPLWLVRASDGVAFAAWESELVEGGSNVYVLPSGEYVSNPEWRGYEEE